MDHDARKRLERSKKESENALKTRDEKLNRLRVSYIQSLQLYSKKLFLETNGRLRKIKQSTNKLKTLTCNPEIQLKSSPAKLKNNDDRPFFFLVKLPHQKFNYIWSSFLQRS